jgi:hypothetical protein
LPGIQILRQIRLEVICRFLIPEVNLPQGHERRVQLLESRQQVGMGVDETGFDDCKEVVVRDTGSPGECLDAHGLQFGQEHAAIQHLELDLVAVRE